jgi:hypothetical protein
LQDAVDFNKSFVSPSDENTLSGIGYDAGGSASLRWYFISNQYPLAYTHGFSQ